MRFSALTAESENKEKIEEAGIQINDSCPVKLSEDEKVLLKILKEWRSLPAGKLYDLYIKNAKHPKGERSFRNYMESLCSKGLVSRW